MKRRYDPYWKGILEEVFDDFLRFVFPDADKVLDFGKKFEFLDKELGQISPKPGKNPRTRHVDKLVRVFLRDGQERCILVHVEVQGYRDANFARRMFTYYYRIMDRFGWPITAIVIFSGANSKRMPCQFEDQCMGTRLLYQYNTVAISDYTDSNLEQSENPFALVLLIAKKALQQGKNVDAVLLEEKLKLAKLLVQKGLFNKPKIKMVFWFLNNYICFEKTETYRIFEQQVDNITEKKDTMGIIEQVCEVRQEEGRKKGLKEGDQKARRQMVENLLRNTKFSADKIASLANVTLAFVNRVKKELAAK
jgi:Putative transposase, YhgA-like